MTRYNCLVKINASPKEQIVRQYAIGSTEFVARDNLIEQIHDDVTEYVNLRVDIMDCHKVG